jgi:hypothetical protein
MLLHVLPVVLKGLGLLDLDLTGSEAEFLAEGSATNIFGLNHDVPSSTATFLTDIICQICNWQLH